MTQVNVGNPRSNMNALCRGAHELRRGHGVVVYFYAEDGVEPRCFGFACDVLYVSCGPSRSGDDSEPESFRCAHISPSASTIRLSVNPRKRTGVERGNLQVIGCWVMARSVIGPVHPRCASTRVRRPSSGCPYEQLRPVVAHTRGEHLARGRQTGRTHGRTAQIQVEQVLELCSV